MINQKKITLLAGSLLLALSVQAQSKVQGYVFEDANRNGKMDGREKGIAQVAVTNGLEVVLTDKKGKYTLPIGKDNIIAVIKPSGYKTPTDANNLPRFYYIYKPGGSPAGLEYKGVAPTGPLPKSVNFALSPSPETDAFTTLVFGDPQPYSKEEVDFFARGVVSEVEGVKNVVFGLSLGDLVGNDLALFNPYIEAVKKVGIPWYNLMGNHDMNFDVKADSLSDETYEAHFGPANYAFNYGKAHFIVLDDILYPDPRGKSKYWAGFRKDQLDFIENDLKHVPKDRLVVLAFHIPLKPGFRQKDLNRLFELLKDYPHTLSLSAHTHIQKQDFFTKEDGWLQDRPHHEYNAGTTSGNWYSGKLDANGTPEATMPDGTPKGYAFLTITGNQYVIDYKVTTKPRDYRMALYAPKVVPQLKSTTASLYANFFMGSEKDILEYRVDDGPWKRMAFYPDFDPMFLNKLNEWDTTEELFPGPVRRPSNARNSTHLWRASIPSNLEPGVHVIEVKVKDMFGRTFTDKISYRIEKSKPLPEQALKTD
ncbi:calcineurin-like phosphoesterase C-terminal domain-containing protein [Botryobacter ruber]|uniref:calcineurin-like phosphoesterase C-terminal domain-containing protein n=1 Tax=Botryobacter ruber TaxID=2171629 RepID=UPI000E0AD512|nr:calcineurin-like phosphoesterase C-terminal domain-containing protein [Botryobacter ruber]